MEWTLDFITEENFVKHISATIEKYGEKLESYVDGDYLKRIYSYAKILK